MLKCHLCGNDHRVMRLDFSIFDQDGREAYGGRNIHLCLDCRHQLHDLLTRRPQPPQPLNQGETDDADDLDANSDYDSSTN